MGEARYFAGAMRTELAIIIPCFNEEDALPPLLSELDGILGSLNRSATLIVVDDGSTDRTAALALAHPAQHGRIEVIRIPYTVGHQEAIYQGLLFASEIDAERVVVMDGDGQDDPSAIADMLDRSESIVFVARGKREETTGFKLGYALYRVLFRLVAGRSMRFGNYSMVDRRVLLAVIDRGFLHYAASLSKRPETSITIRSDRRKRTHGSSKMGVEALGMHAFRSLIEYREEMLSMFLRASLVLGAAFLMLLVAVFAIKIFTDLAIPGWASTLSATLLNSMLLCIGLFVIGVILSRPDARGARKRFTRMHRE